MTAGSCQVGCVDDASARHGLFHALAAAIGLAALCTTPAAGADWDAPAPGLRMPDSLLSLHDMYPDLVTARAGRGFASDFAARAGAFPKPAPEADFRGAGVLDRSGDLPLTNAWQRMSDFRSEDGIRLLTVWQSANGTVALHQGKHGGASLQWTSQALNRSGASRGLFDHLVSSIHEMRAPLHFASPGTSAQPMPAASRFATP
jgi:hypothetical protein